MKWLTEDSCECPVCRYQFESMEKNVRIEEEEKEGEEEKEEEKEGEEKEGEENGEGDDALLQQERDDLTHFQNFILNINNVFYSVDNNIFNYIDNNYNNYEHDDIELD